MSNTEFVQWLDANMILSTNSCRHLPPHDDADIDRLLKRCRFDMNGLLNISHADISDIENSNAYNSDIEISDIETSDADISDTDKALPYVNFDLFDTPTDLSDLPLMGNPIAPKYPVHLCKNAVQATDREFQEMKMRFPSQRRMREKINIRHRSELVFADTTPDLPALVQRVMQDARRRDQACEDFHFDSYSAVCNYYEDGRAGTGWRRCERAHDIVYKYNFARLDSPHAIATRNYKMRDAHTHQELFRTNMSDGDLLITYGLDTNCEFSDPTTRKRGADKHKRICITVHRNANAGL